MMHCLPVSVLASWLPVFNTQSAPMLNHEPKYKTPVLKAPWLLIWLREKGRALTVGHWNNEHHCPTVTLGPQPRSPKCDLLLLLKFSRVTASSVPRSRNALSQGPAWLPSLSSLLLHGIPVGTPFPHTVFKVTTFVLFCSSSPCVSPRHHHCWALVLLLNHHILHLLRMGKFELLQHCHLSSTSWRWGSM